MQKYFAALPPTHPNQVWKATGDMLSQVFETIGDTF